MSTISAVKGAGYRAGKANPRLIIPGGTRGIKRIAEPTNPFADTFRPERRNWLLAQVWDYFRVEGMRYRLTAKYRHG